MQPLNPLNVFHPSRQTPLTKTNMFAGSALPFHQKVVLYWIEENEHCSVTDSSTPAPQDDPAPYGISCSTESFWASCCSFTQSCLTLCHPMDCSTRGFPVLHYLLEFAQTHVHWISDAIQPSHSLSSPSPPAFNLSQHQGLFQWVSSSHR